MIHFSPPPPHLSLIPSISDTQGAGVSPTTMELVGETFHKVFRGYGTEPWLGTVEASLGEGKFEVSYPKDPDPEKRYKMKEAELRRLLARTKVAAEAAEAAKEVGAAGNKKRASPGGVAARPGKRRAGRRGGRSSSASPLPSTPSSSSSSSSPPQAAPLTKWAQCEEGGCLKWRKIPASISDAELGKAPFTCADNRWDRGRANCNVAEEVVSDGERSVDPPAAGAASSGEGGARDLLCEPVNGTVEELVT